VKKSSSLAILGGEFYMSLPRQFGDIEFLHDMDGAWLAEIPDMSGFKGRDMEHIKSFLTVREDRFRVKYGRRSETHPRHCVFAGTSNSTDWLEDATGGRRFIPIECREINLDYIRETREQLFAEARDIYQRVPKDCLPHARAAAGADWWIMPSNDTLAEQAARQLDDPWTDTIRRWLMGREFTEITDILNACLQINIEHHDQRAARRVSSILKRLGYENKADRSTGKLVKRWRLSLDKMLPLSKTVDAFENPQAPF
jgi:putative DNA primase/helicase